MLNSNWGVALLLFVAIHSGIAQQLFVPGAPSTTFPKALEQQLVLRQKRDINAYSGKYRNKIEEVYEERTEEFRQQYENQFFLVDTNYQSYLDKLLNKIINSNVVLQQDEYRILLSRSSAPNAYCQGDGTLVLNLGLVLRLENEAQLAFIICHEIAHQHKDHVNQGIIKRVDYLYSKETKKELRRINRQSYNKLDATLELLEEYAYSSTRHMRMHEEEADSVAISYMKNMDYPLEAATRVMELLDVIDQPDTISLRLDTVFNFTAYPFKTKWIEEQRTGIRRMNTKKPKESLWFNVDSLKTHPNCQDRKKALIRQIQQIPTKETIAEQSEDFLQLRSVLVRELIAAAVFLDRFDLILYYSLKARRLFPDDPYIVSNIGFALNSIYELQRDHLLGKYLPQPSHRDGLAYKEVLTFIHRLRLSEIQQIAFHFLDTQAPHHTADEHLIFEYYTSCKNSERLEQAQRLKQLYEEKYPEGKYLKDF